MQPRKSEAERAHPACGANFRIPQLLSWKEQNAGLEDPRIKEVGGDETEVWGWQTFLESNVWKKVLIAGGLMVLMISCSSLTRTILVAPEIPGANYVGDKACYDCHTNISRSFPSSAHARVHLPNAEMVGQTGCESCHGPGSKHIAAGGGRGKFIVNPGKEPSACFQCHLQTHAEFSLPQRHPVIEGRMNCVQCHDPHGSDILKPAGGLAMARLNESCANCHREQTRPFVFEHEALREGCTVCHSPHGSINRKMLTESDSNLCLRCHAQTQGPGVASGEIYIGQSSHTAYLRQGTCWSAGCHTAVHGSNVHPRMFY
jgi:predicted CXXCH cytochrome family protein